MSDVILSAIITGLISGAVGGVVASSFYVRVTHSSRAQGSAQAITGRGNQTALAGEEGQAASSRRGNVYQTRTRMSPERRAQLKASIVNRAGNGLPNQLMVLENIGDSPADELTVSPAPDGGGFITQPDWSAFPRRLAGRQNIKLPCVTRGTGSVTLVVSFVEDREQKGPMLLQAAHE